MKSHPTVPLCVLDTGDLYAYYKGSIKRKANKNANRNIIKSMRTIIQGYHMYTPFGTLTHKSYSPLKAFKYRFQQYLSREHNNEVSSYNYCKNRCVETLSERLERNSNAGKDENNKKQKIVRNSRTFYRSPCACGGSGGILATQVYGSLIQCILILFLSLSQVCSAQAVVVEQKYTGLAQNDFNSDSSNNPYSNGGVTSSTYRITTKVATVVGGGSDSSGIIDHSSGVINYMNKMNNLERSVAAVLIKVAYGTTSTTKRSIPDNSYLATITTIATPLLTTLRYLERSSKQQEINVHLRNYELDLERDHALPTSAPNADILKSNNNPTYPNPNRHYNHERERQRQILNTTPLPTLSNVLKKINGQLPTIPMYSADIPSYSPPARSFFTPPLPPEYQNPFADKPTLRGTNNEGVITNTGSYINRRPIPPPSLMPGHERVPYRPPDLVTSTGGSNAQDRHDIILSIGENKSPAMVGTFTEIDIKTALNTPSQNVDSYAYSKRHHFNASGVEISSIDTIKKLYNSSIHQEHPEIINDHSQKHGSVQEVLPGIRRILSGSNGNKGEIPDVLLKQVTSRPLVSFHTPPSSPVVHFNSTNKLQLENVEDSGISSTSNINRSKSSSPKPVDLIEDTFIVNQNTYEKSNNRQSGISLAVGTTSETTAESGIILGTDPAISGATSTTSTTSNGTLAKNHKFLAKSTNEKENGTAFSTSSSIFASVSHSTWAIAWNIHIYFSVVLFTILAVYSFYKVLTYNKLTHLFSQSYFMCIHIILILICSLRIFYLCYDAYNIHATFNFFVAELLLNLPSTFLTISFSVLMLYLFLKALNHKINRYSALIRPLTVVIGCGVHVILCITLHYVESYTLNNHMQQQLLYQQQQHYRRQQNRLPSQQEFTSVSTSHFMASAVGGSAHSSVLLQFAGNPPPIAVSGTLPPRVLSLLCQIIYIFICFFLGLLYLYLYRVLKQILRNKSQNYIHGYQNLSYAIHITIATALLFVLLAALQIFGAISISTTRPLLQKVTTDIDWLQWGYQFSLRLIEIAIIILLSWVAGLETGSVMTSVTASMSNRDTRYGLSGEHGTGSVIFGSAININNREKHVHHQFHHNHSNVAGFFLPCTSSSSQEQFETDYPAVCNANTNLHTYTMRTGKLIYDDTFALNSLSGNRQSQLISVGNNTIATSSGPTRNQGECEVLTQPTYQRPYDSGSLNSNRTNHDATDYCSQGTFVRDGSGCYSRETRRYPDCFRDASTDHYENPNIDLRYSASSSAFGAAVSNDTGDQKFQKTSTTSTTASSSGGSGSSALSQQQILLLQSESCYSEPLQPANGSNYNFHNFENAMHCSGGENSGDNPGNYWLQSHHGLIAPRALISYKGKQQKNMQTTLDINTYENPERRNSKYSTHNTSHSVVYNSFARGLFNDIHKGGTLSTIDDGKSSVKTVIHDGGSTSSSAASSNVSAEHIHTGVLSSDYHQRTKCGNMISMSLERERDHDRSSELENFSRSSLDRKIAYQHSKLHRHQNPNNDERPSNSNVECSNVTAFENSSSITHSTSTLNNDSRMELNETQAVNNSTSDDTYIGKTQCKNNTHSNTFFLLHSHSHPRCSTVQLREELQKQEKAVVTFNPNLVPSDSNASSSSTSNTIGLNPIMVEVASNRSDDTAVLVAKQGFVRFRAIDDINNAQGVGIHNASIRN